MTAIDESPVKAGYNTILVEQRGPVLELVLNRPQARNAMTQEMLDEFESILDDAQRDNSVKAVTLRGNGAVFSAGHDLKEVADWFANPGGIEKMAEAARVPKMDRAWYFTKPLIAGVHGYVGPHAILMLSSFDFIIAAEGTRFSFEQTRVSGGLPHSVLPMLIPMRAYLKLAMMGGWFSAETARGWDFVQRVVPEGEVEAETRRWAEEVSKIPSQQVQSLKDTAHRHYEAFGLLNLVKPMNPGGHGSEEDMRYFQAIINKGLREALAERDAAFDPSLAEI